jgi:hypothetical protein
MLYELYCQARSFLVNELIEADWSLTVKALSSIKALNLAYAATSTGPLTERIDRFNKLQALATDAEKEKNKVQLLQGLLAQDPVTGRNIFFAEVVNFIADKHLGFPNLFSRLSETECFSGPNRNECMFAFLQGVFALDKEGRSIVLEATLANPQDNSLSVVLGTLEQHGFLAGNFGYYFLEKIKVNSQPILLNAVLNYSTYLQLRGAMSLAGCTAMEFRALLNTELEVEDLGEKRSCTPLMYLICKTAGYQAHKFKEFTQLIQQLTRDGAELSTLQMSLIRGYLNKLERAADELLFFSELRVWVDSTRKISWTAPAFRRDIELPAPHHFPGLFPIAEERQSGVGLPHVAVTVLPYSQDDRMDWPSNIV